jgi:hypothetical protein
MGSRIIKWIVSISSVVSLILVFQNCGSRFETNLKNSDLPSQQVDPAPTADFESRCNAPGVVRCIGFDTETDITGRYGDNTGLYLGESRVPIPSLDNSTKASGNSSLMFIIKPQTGEGRRLFCQLFTRLVRAIQR